MDTRPTHTASPSDHAGVGIRIPDDRADANPATDAPAAETQRAAEPSPRGRLLEPAELLADGVLQGPGAAAELLTRGIVRHTSPADLKPAPPRPGSQDALRWPSLIGRERRFRVGAG